MLQLWAISSQSKSKVFWKHKGTRAQRILENGRQVFGLNSSSGLICSSLVFRTLRVQLPVEVHLLRRKTRPKQGCIIYFEFNIGSFLHNCFKVSLSDIFNYYFCKNVITKVHIEKCTLEKHFGKINVGKIYLGKILFEKRHFGKRHFVNIARGTTDPGYWLYNLNNLQVASLVLVDVNYIAWFKSWPTRLCHSHCHIALECPIGIIS